MRQDCEETNFTDLLNIRRSLLRNKICPYQREDSLQSIFFVDCERECKAIVGCSSAFVPLEHGRRCPPPQVKLHYKLVEPPSDHHAPQSRAYRHLLSLPPVPSPRPLSPLPAPRLCHRRQQQRRLRPSRQSLRRRKLLTPRRLTPTIVARALRLLQEVKKLNEVLKTNRRVLLVIIALKLCPSLAPPPLPDPKYSHLSRVSLRHPVQAQRHRAVLYMELVQEVRHTKPPAMAATVSRLELPLHQVLCRVRPFRATHSQCRRPRSTTVALALSLRLLIRRLLRQAGQ